MGEEQRKTAKRNIFAVGKYLGQWRRRRTEKDNEENVKRRQIYGQWRKKKNGDGKVGKIWRREILSLRTESEIGKGKRRKYLKAFLWFAKKKNNRKERRTIFTIFALRDETGTQRKILGEKIFGL